MIMIIIIPQPRYKVMVHKPDKPVGMWLRYGRACVCVCTYVLRVRHRMRKVRDRFASDPARKQSAGRRGFAVASCNRLFVVVVTVTCFVFFSKNPFFLPSGQTSSPDMMTMPSSMEYHHEVMSYRTPKEHFAEGVSALFKINKYKITLGLESRP